MPRPRKLEQAEIEARLAELRGWSIESGKLHREFRFADFERAFAFMTRVAREAERLDHHPEWRNVYATVRVDLTTHDAGGLTELDFALAEAMDEIAADATPDRAPVAPARVIPSLAALAEHEGEHLGTSDWVEVSQERIDAFADATGDHQWIHVDRERAASESPFGGPVAHGYLTLALAPALLTQLIEVEGCSRVINGGIDRLRLKAPVPAGARVRLAATLSKVKIVRGEMAHVTLTVRMEIEGESKPALQGELVYVYFAD